MRKPQVEMQDLPETSEERAGASDRAQAEDSAEVDG